MSIFTKLSLAAISVMAIVYGVSQTYAQTIQQVMPAPSTSEYKLNPQSEAAVRARTNIIVSEFLGTISCQLAGINAVETTRLCGKESLLSGQFGIDRQSGGLLGSVVYLMGETYSIPVSNHEYIAYVQSNFGITDKTYAQADSNVPTTGYQSLSPLLSIWSSLRNLVYLLFVLVFVVLGLGIMFRLQIDPRTVMNIQNQIPKIIISLILITFSYAIAGLMVDLMWIVTMIVITTLSPTTLQIPIDQLLSDLFGFPIFFADKVLSSGTNPFGGILTLSGTIGSGTGQVIHSILSPSDIFGSLVPTASSDQCAEQGAACIIQTFVKGTLFGLVGGLISILLSIVIGALVFIIVLFALVIALFRLWFALLKAYVFILIDVAAAPLYILGGLLPGGVGFSGWIRSLAANLSAFPTAIAILMLAKVFLLEFGNLKGAVTADKYFLPPLIGDPGNPSTLGGLVAFAVIMIAPEALNITKGFFKAPELKLLDSVQKGFGFGQQAAMPWVQKPIGHYMQRSKTGGAIGSGALLFDRQRDRIADRNIPIVSWMARNSRDRQLRGAKAGGLDPEGTHTP